VGAFWTSLARSWACQRKTNERHTRRTFTGGRHPVSDHKGCPTAGVGGGETDVTGACGEIGRDRIDGIRDHALEAARESGVAGMNDTYPASIWGDEDVPVPLHQVSQRDLADTPVALEAPGMPGAGATIDSGGDAAAADGVGDPAIGPSDADDTSGCLLPGETRPEPALAELLSRPAPRWLYGVAGSLLAALCALSFALGWQKGAVVAVEATSRDAQPAVMSDTFPQTTTGYA
jgi:hypothetical protein